MSLGLPVGPTGSNYDAQQHCIVPACLHARFVYAIRSCKVLPIGVEGECAFGSEGVLTAL